MLANHQCGPAASTWRQCDMECSNISIPAMNFKIKNLTLQPHLVGVNELTGSHHFPLAGYSPYHFLFDISFRVTSLATMTSSNGNIFRVTGPFTGHRWTPFTKSNDAEFWCFHWSAPKKRLSKQSWGGELRLNRAHYDVIVMQSSVSPLGFVFVYACDISPQTMIKI